jgi:hypothetical protein
MATRGPIGNRVEVVVDGAEHFARLHEELGTLQADAYRTTDRWVLYPAP